MLQIDIIVMNIQQLITIGFFLLLGSTNIQAQKAWTLQECVEKAIQENLQVSNGEIAVQSAAIDIVQSRHARLPNLSFNSNVGWNFGRTVDPTQNLFTTETFFSNGSTFSSNVVLFNGNRINNLQKQSLANHQAAQKDLEQVKRDISLQVATIYLNILFAQENIVNAERQLASTQDQLTLLNKQIAVGNLPENNRLEVEAQIAVNEQSIIENQNLLQIQQLNLKQLLRLNLDENIDIVVPKNLESSIDPDLITFEQLFEKAQANQASLFAADWRIQSAVLNEKITRAEALPALLAAGNLRTNYSNKGYNITGYDQTIVEQDIYFNNQSATIGIPQNVPILQQTPFFDQINNNLSYGIGISLNIPIYNNYSIKSNQQRAKLNTEKAKIGYEQALESLKTTVAQAYADAKAAKVRYKATEKTQNAQSMVYLNALKRFELGNTSIFELNRLKALSESAETNYLIAKYDYIFRSRVLDYYLGNPIQID